MARVCVIRQFYYPHDPRLRREVAALALAGHQVDVICMRFPGLASHETDSLVTLHRLPLTHRRGGQVGYLVEYLAFMLLAGLVAGVLHLRHRFDVVQVNSVPDSLVFAATIPRLLGARVLLDLCECMPEFYASKYGTTLEHPAVRLVARVEQASIRYADMAITCSAQMRESFVQRGAAPGKVTVILNNADEDEFDPRRYPPRPRDPGQFTIICHGTVEERYGLDTAIEAIALIGDDIPGLCLEIYGDGSYLPYLRQLAADRGVSDRIIFAGTFVPLEELLRAIAAADVGLVAMKRDAFRDLTLCNKLYDFIVMRRPALVSRTRAVQEYFDDDCFEWFDSDDPADLARAIRRLHADPARGERLVAQASRANEPYRWPRQRERYQSVIARLARGPERLRSRAASDIEAGG